MLLRSLQPNEYYGIPTATAKLTTKERLRLVSPIDIKRIASSLVSIYNQSYDISKHEMVSEFGATADILSDIWNAFVILKKGLHKDSKPLHLLWWMYQVKQYPTKKQFRKYTRTDPTTTRKHMKRISKAFLRYSSNVVSSFIKLSLP